MQELQISRQYKGNDCIMDLNKQTSQKFNGYTLFFAINSHAIAHNEIYDTNTPRRTYSTEQANIQQFDLWSNEFKEWEQEWWNRFMYYEKHG